MNKYSNTRPNVLLVVTDQQRFDTLGCYGNPYIDTPNLDRFAQKAYCLKTATARLPSVPPAGPLS